MEENNVHSEHQKGTICNSVYNTQYESDRFNNYDKGKGISNNLSNKTYNIKKCNDYDFSITENTYNNADDLREGKVRHNKFNMKNTEVPLFWYFYDLKKNPYGFIVPKNIL